MRKKITIMMLSIFALCASLFVQSGVVASASVEIVLSGLSNQINDSYQNNNYIEIDTREFSLSVGGSTASIVDSSVTLDLDGRVVENLSEVVGVYKFKPTTAGIYKLTVSVNYGESEPYVLMDYVTILSDSAVNAKYEIGSSIELSSFGDTKLYSALLGVVKTYAEEKGDRFNGSTLYSEMLNYPDLTKISISGKEISDISGLNKLRLDYVKEISIKNCAISSVNADCFENAPNLESINFANNSITSFALPTIRNLKSVDLSSNQLNSFNVSNCFGDDLDVNLAGNNISLMTDIVLGNGFEGKIKLNLIGNNVYEINDQYFDTQKFEIKVGVQGIKNWSETSATTSSKGVRFYKTGIDGLKLNIYDMSVRVPELKKSLSDSDIETGKNYVDILLPIGSYEYKYELNGEDIYDKYDASKKYYKSQSFEVLPSSATYKLEHKGKMYDSLGKVTGSVKVYLESVDETGEIWYSVNAKDWVKGDTIECLEGGTFSIRVKVVVGKYESAETFIMVKTSLNSVLPDFVMFFIVLFCALILFVLVVPVVSKRFFKR